MEKAEVCMRIAHICLAAFYIDGYGYQENILPRVHKKSGHDVIVVASTENYINNKKLDYVEPGSYVNEDGIDVYRIAYKNLFSGFLARKIRAYVGLYEILENFDADLIFLHDVQFLDLLKIKKFKKLNKNIVVFADSHTDLINSARTFFSRKLLHGVLYKNIVKYCDHSIDNYYPTLPMRQEFLCNVYGLDYKKMKFLPFGFDSSLSNGMDRKTVRSELRKDLGIEENEFVFVTGGKLDLRKNIHVLIDVFSKLCFENKLTNSRLVVFGQKSDEFENALKKIDICDKVIFIDWVSARDIYKYFWMADLAIFPGTHSVLWEEAAGCGIGAVFYKWDGMEYLDAGGNCLFIGDAQQQTIANLLTELADPESEIAKNLNINAIEFGTKKFSYDTIAQSIIDDAALLLTTKAK